MAITRHKNQQSLADYDDIDDDHMRLSKILSKEKQVVMLPTSSAQTVHNLPQSLPGPTYQPIFNIHNSTVIFGASSSTLSQQVRLSSVSS